MEIRVNYKSDEKYRKSMTDLAKKTFGIDLESWYLGGYWKDDYIPYSCVEDGKIVSNVSLNICNFKWRSRVHHLAQLGTVMTDEAYRDRGYIRALMEKIITECERSFEGMYLYAESRMIPFYEKFGFVPVSEYQCSKSINITNNATIEKIPMISKEDRDRMVDIIQRRQQYGERIMVNNQGLFMFYLTGPFSDNVYYVPSPGAYAVAETKDDTLTLYAVFCDEKVSLGDIIASFGSGIKKVVMGFMPENNTGFELKKIASEDSVLLARGGIFETNGNERFMFPEISHA